MITKNDLINDIKKAGIKNGDILNLKISLKSIGWVEGGANTVIDAFVTVVGEEGTLVTDSFVPVKKYKYLKKHDYITDDSSPSYAGAIANAMLKYPGARRSKHPIQKFAILGKLANEFADNHNENSYAYDVLKKMSYLGAKNIRLGDKDKVVGVGTTHVAIGILQLQQKRQKFGCHYLDKSGKKHLFLVNWAGGCVSGFNKLLPKYREIGAFLYEGKVGNADIIVSDMQKTLAWEIEEGKKNPQFFFCNQPECIECRSGWKFSDTGLIHTMWENIKIKRYDWALCALLIKLFGKYYPQNNEKK